MVFRISIQGVWRGWGAGASVGCVAGLSISRPTHSAGLDATLPRAMSFPPHRQPSLLLVSCGAALQILGGLWKHACCHQAEMIEHSSQATHFQLVQSGGV